MFAHAYVCRFMDVVDAHMRSHSPVHLHARAYVYARVLTVHMGGESITYALLRVVASAFAHASVFFSGLCETWLCARTCAHADNRTEHVPTYARTYTVSRSAEETFNFSLPRSGNLTSRMRSVVKSAAAKHKCTLADDLFVDVNSSVTRRGSIAYFEHDARGCASHVLPMCVLMYAFTRV